MDAATSEPELIAQVCLHSGSGGAERYLIELATRLSAERPVLVITAAGSWTEEEARSRSLRVETIPEPRSSFSLPTVVRLAGVLRRNRVALAHSHLGVSDWYVWLATRLFRQPLLVSTEHGISADRPDLFVGTSPGLRLHRLGHRLRMRNTAAVVAVSEYTARAVRRHYLGAETSGHSAPGSGSGVAPARAWRRRHAPLVVVIPPGIDFTRFPDDRVATPGSGEGPVKLLYLGRLEPEKGPDLLLEALKLRPDKAPGFLVTVVGDGSMRAALERAGEAIVEPAGRGVTIEWEGRVADPRPFLRSADLFVLPSRSENLPLALVEAMAAGLPAVACNVGGVAEVVLDGVTGVLVPPGDAAALATAIGECVADRTGLAEMGRQARRHALRFDLDSMAAAVSHLYDALLSERPHPSNGRAGS